MQLATRSGSTTDFQDALFSISNRRLSLVCQKNRKTLSDSQFQVKTTRLDALERQLKVQPDSDAPDSFERDRMARMHEEGFEDSFCPDSRSPCLHTLKLAPLAPETHPCVSHDEQKRHRSLPSFRMLVYRLKLRCNTVPKVDSAVHPRASEFTMAVALASLAHRQKTLADMWANGGLSEHKMGVESNTLAKLKQRLHAWNDVRTEEARSSIESFIRDAHGATHPPGGHRPDSPSSPPRPSRSGSSLSSVSSSSDTDASRVHTGHDPAIGAFGITRL